jgi:hypothetical protein
MHLTCMIWDVNFNMTNPMNYLNKILPREGNDFPRFLTDYQIREFQSARLSALSTSFHLSPEYSSNLETYYLLHWSSDWLYKQVKNDLTTLEHNGILYLLNWTDTPADFKGQIKLSFRKPKDSSFGFCILSPIPL